MHYELNDETGIFTVEPEGALEASDFAAMTEIVDQYIREHGALNGLLVSTNRFPGWTDVDAMLTHFDFVREHHDKIRRVALVSESKVMEYLPAIVGRFVNAEVRHFAADKRADSRAVARFRRVLTGRGR